MAGDFSRNTFDPAKHYSGVLMQQGRVQLDADWNEQRAIEQHRTATETIDVVGVVGVPKGNTGFQIGYTLADGPTIGAGRLYLDGLLCQLDQPATYRRQPHYPQPDISFFGGDPVPLLDGTYVAYLDAWQRDVNFRDDPHIHEVALGEADTATRQQTVWQVRLLPVIPPAGPAIPTCLTSFAEWTTLTTPPTGQMAVRTAPGALPRNPCSLPPTTGYRRLENQFYRVEVQRGGNRAQARFKWSRDNASVETTIEQIDNAIVTVTDLGRDDVLGFATGQWVEIVDDISTLNGLPNALLKITDINVDTRQITLSGSAAAYAANPGLKLRRWDQAADGLSMNALGDWLDLEDGLQVQFAAGSYQAGDYWTFPARTATGNVEWPQTAAVPDALLPMGVQHHYARLALLRVVGGVPTIDDCRKPFPPLTAITASDVLFDNTNCQLPQAQTVQQAIDLLCARKSGGGSCTLTATPGPNWEVIFAQIADGQDAQICFPVGDFPLRNPAIIKGKGHLKLDGSGPGTRIMAPGLEAALVFSGCKSVLIRDMYAETSHAVEPNPNGIKSLNGTLTFQNCPSVDVEQVDLKCGAGPVRAATCLTVINTDKTPGSVRITHCDLQVGHQQQGILLVNIDMATVADNTIRSYGSVAGADFITPLLKNETYRASIRRVLFSHPTLRRPDRNNIVQIDYAAQASFFIRTPLVSDVWQLLIRTNPFPNNLTSQQAMRFLAKLTDRLLLDEAFRRNAQSTLKDLIGRIFDTAQSVAAQGITVGGLVARDLRVLNNTISGCVQGIHVGLSHKGATSRENDSLDTALISGNTLNLRIPPSANNQDRHGIFVGNCRSLIIENNTISLTRLSGAEVLQADGIRVWGQLGRRLMITKNFVVNSTDNQKLAYTDGIHVEPRNERGDASQWVVMWNVAPSQRNTVRVSNGAVDLEGTNTP